MNLIGNINAIPFRRFRGGGGVSPIPPFPSIPGMIARYSALGLTNEQMAENPVWKDLTGNGHDLQMKNFAWSGMSGVGGYVQNFNNFGNNLAADKVRIDERNSNSIKVTILTTGIGNAIYILKNIYQFNKSYFIKISSEGYNEGDLSLSFYAPSTSTATTVKVPLNPNGITEIPAIKEDDFLAVYLEVGGKVGSITIEQLPLYPGFILGDGVDDFAVTEKELNFEDTYTVYTAFIPFQDDPARTMSLCGKNRLKDFYMYYSSLNSIGFFSVDKSVSTLLSNGFNLVACKKTSDKMLIKNLITGKVAEVSVDELIYNPGLYYLWRSATIANYSKTAIAGQIIYNGHFTTDEEDEKVLNWHKKQYTWLFPDQAWTVVGKTNEDTDRATIANITGNSNNLVLYNFAFSGNSGYGEYAYNFNDTSWISIPDYGVISDKTSKSFNIKSFVLADYPVLYTAVNKDSSIKKVKIKVTNSIPGFYFGNKPANQIIDLSTDGIYEIPSYNSPNDVTQYGFRCSNVNDSCNITIEQIPEYEGYLVTDGVDDKITSSAFGMGKDFTVVGEWTLLQNINVSSLRKQASFIIRNHDLGLSLFINRVSHAALIYAKSLRAFCSNGVLYKSDWTEQIDTTPQDITSSNSELLIASHYDSKSEYDKIAFKNLAIYPTVLSKDDCIKAYNYLQTLKAK